jgi:transcriptional regulator GlxA family with amidase domain
MQKRIAIFGYEGASALDITGPAEVFAVANQHSKTSSPPYRIDIMGARATFFTTESGVSIQSSLAEVGAKFDTVLIPGGAGLRDTSVRADAVDWIMKHQRRTRRIVSVCTGIYALAGTGLLDGRRATTHWRFAADVARLFPTVTVEPDAIFIRDGRFYTSAGITAGIDLALALVEEDLGSGVALAVARELVVYLRRPGSQRQYSEPLRFQTRAIGRFADLSAWISTHLSSDLSCNALASRARVCRRHFTRLFKATHGVGPAQFVEHLRMDEAARLLASGSRSMEAVAKTVGYMNVDVFRRAFERHFVLAPSVYRNRFASITEERI